jgi:outer membrane protein TolC
MRKQSIMYLLIFTVLSSLQAQTVLNADTAADLAVRQNLNLRRSSIDVSGRKRGADSSWNSLIPSLSAGASVNHGISLTGDLPPARDTWIPGLSLSASWSFSPAIMFNMEKAKTDYEAGILSYAAAEQQLELEVRKLFYQILYLRSVVELAERNQESARARYEETVALVRVGQASTLEALSARVDFENLGPQRKGAETQYLNALESFRLILGIAADEEVRLAGTLDEAIDGIATGTFAAVKSESLSIAALLKTMESIAAQRKAAASQLYVPSLRLSWNSGPAYTKTTDRWIDSTGSFSVTLGISLEGFLPGSVQRNQIAALDDGLESYRIQVRENLRNQDTRIRQLERTIEQSLETIEALKLNVELAEETYAMYTEAYRLGAADFGRLRSVDDSLSLASLRLQQEYYTLIAASLDLEKELNIPFGSIWK